MIGFEVVQDDTVGGINNNNPSPTVALVDSRHTTTNTFAARQGCEAALLGGILKSLSDTSLVFYQGR